MSRLAASSRVVDARVVDTRVLTSARRGDQARVRYAFEVDGQTYAYGDPSVGSGCGSGPGAGGEDQNRRTGYTGPSVPTGTLQTCIPPT